MCCLSVFLPFKSKKVGKRTQFFFFNFFIMLHNWFLLPGPTICLLPPLTKNVPKIPPPKSKENLSLPLVIASSSSPLLMLVVSSNYHLSSLYHHPHVLHPLLQVLHGHLQLATAYHVHVTANGNRVVAVVVMVRRRMVVSKEKYNIQGVPTEMIWDLSIFC
jgi:hypothetical protein